MVDFPCLIRFQDANTKNIQQLGVKVPKNVTEGLYAITKKLTQRSYTEPAWDEFYD